MRTLKSLKKNIYIVISVMIFVSFVMVVPGHSSMSDNSDRFSSEQSDVFSPGYINAVKQHADAIIRQVNGGSKNAADNSADYFTADNGKRS